MKTYLAWQSYKKETPNRGYWDMQMIEDVFSRQMWSPVNANEFEHVNSIQDIPRTADGAVVVLPARHHAHEQWTDKLNDDCTRFKWVIFMLVGDEESAFPAWRLKHPNKRIWLMMARDQQDMHKMVDTRMLNGYPTQLRQFAGKHRDLEIEKPLDWFFSGQITHPRREVFAEYAQAIADDKSRLVKTAGFTQGIEHGDYYTSMASAKVIPCPAGAQAPDSFRFCEALEFGCIPLADNRSSNLGFPPGYWNYVFRDDKLPFPIIEDWRAFPALLVDILENWKPLANKVGAWWLNYKRDFTYQLENDINALRGSVPEATNLKDKITVIVSSSPIPSHPSPWMIKETIASIRAHLPESEIIIMQDGIRQEQQEWSKRYEDYKQAVLELCRNEWHNVLPVFFDEFLHQAEMTRRTLDRIKTPHLLFVEHDTPLCEDQPIEWDGIVCVLESGWAESVRLHHLDVGYIHPEHWDLMIDKERQDVCGIKVMRTNQYSQRAHIATVDFYRRMMATFTENSRTFIEDRVYTLFYEGKSPFKLAIYTPEGHIKRSRDLNGREGGPKFDDRLVY